MRSPENPRRSLYIYFSKYATYVGDVYGPVFRCASLSLFHNYFCNKISHRVYFFKEQMKVRKKYVSLFLVRLIKPETEGQLP